MKYRGAPSGGEGDGEDDGGLADALSRAFPDSGDWTPERVSAFREACESCADYGGDEGEDDEETPAGGTKSPGLALLFGKK